MLTRLPTTPPSGEGENPDWSLVAGFFPLCGWIVGALSAAAALAPLAFYLERHPGLDVPHATFAILSAAIFTAATAWMSRAFHLDGFCDTVDAATAPGASKERRLEIMKDSNAGAAAACAVAILIVLKTAALAALIGGARFPHGVGMWRAAAVCAPPLLAIPVLGRMAMLSLAWMGDYPKDSGTGKSVVDGTNALSMAMGIAATAALAAILPVPAFFAAVSAAAATAVFWNLKSDSLIGGVNGDILGACCETAECAVAIVLAFSL